MVIGAEIEIDTLTIVVPIFNEEESITETARRLAAICQNHADEVDIDLLFVDDGSSDGSLDILKSIAAGNNKISIISFSRNFGHQIAITAGIDVATGDYVAVIDADLQDPPELLIDMYRIARAGFDVVYGKRRKRDGESHFKKLMASSFYRLFNYLCDTEIPPDTGDFRLISKRVVDAFRQLRERHRFVRGMIPWLGFRATHIEYDRAARYAGGTKYPVRKMFALASNAVFSFSRKPLTVAIHLGLATIAFGFLFGLYMLYLKLFTDIPILGLTAILLAIIVFSGVQILLIGVVGEYVARIFEEAKGRPLYLVAETVNV